MKRQHEKKAGKQPHISKIIDRSNSAISENTAEETKYANLGRRFFQHIN